MNSNMYTLLKAKGTLLRDDGHTEIYCYLGEVYEVHFTRREVFSHISTPSDSKWKQMAKDQASLGK